MNATDDLQTLCEEGQRLLMEMKYIEAEETLATAEARAWSARDWDTLSRLYMPLQEARRQFRQRCGEGIVHLSLNEGQTNLNPQKITEQYPQGQLLIAGQASIAPALKVRKLAREHKLYLETFLAAAWHTEAGTWISIIPHESSPLPSKTHLSLAELKASLPKHSILLNQKDLPPNLQPGSVETYSKVMNLWETLHTPFLNAAIQQPTPMARMEAYRTTIQIDKACEKAHQYLSDEAKRARKAK